MRDIGQHSPAIGDFETRFDKLITLNESGNVTSTYIVTSQGRSYFAKRLKPRFATNDFYRSTYRKEYEIGKRICHPNIARYEHFCDDSNECYILMENIEGMTLDKFINASPYYFNDSKNIDRLLMQLLDALKLLHNNDIVYSDLKPQNIMITQVNKDLKLVDMASCFTSAYNNTAFATKGFASPEQRQKGKLDATTDIYCVGKLLEYINEHSQQELPRKYRKIEQKCLQAEKDKRYQCVDEIIKIINRPKNLIRKAAITIIALLSLFMAYKIASYNPYVIAWWDRFQIIPPKVEFDTEYDKIYYRITSSDKKECAVVGANKCVNLYIRESVVINGIKYDVTEIADNAFSYYTHIISVSIPESIKTIGEESFRMCKNLALVNIPEGCTAIKHAAFWGCESVRHIKLPSTLKHIGTASFAGLAIESIEIPEGITTLPLDAFGICKNLKHVKLPQSLTTIERGVFYECHALEEITLPKNVAQIGEYLFWNCDKLTHIYNLSPEPQAILPIHKNLSQITLHVPAESVNAYSNADIWNQMHIVPL